MRRLHIATPADIPALRRVRMAVRENALSDPTRITPDDYREHLEVLGRGWLVESDAGVLGFAVARRTDGNIWALFVDPAHEGQGIGTALHDEMLRWLAAEGVTRPWLTTTPGTRAERFYRQSGWRDWPPHPAGEMRMVRDLTRD
jgi:GNAT superfamily N-acetyltransferase